MWIGHCAWRARYSSGRSGLTIGPAFMTSLKKAGLSRVGGVVCADKPVWMTSLNASTSLSSRGGRLLHSLARVSARRSFQTHSTKEKEMRIFSKDPDAIERLSPEQYRVTQQNGTESP